MILRSVGLNKIIHILNIPPTCMTVNSSVKVVSMLFDGCKFTSLYTYHNSYRTCD